VTGVVVRDAAKGHAFESKWGVPAFRTVDELLEQVPLQFAVTCVPWDVNPSIVKVLTTRGVPVLSETPPAPDVAQMTDLCRSVVANGGKVQVAEQYHLRPHHVAQIAFAESGKLGRIHEAQVSVGHGYHGISIMRRFLRVLYEDCTIHGSSFRSRSVAGPGKLGSPAREELSGSIQHLYRFEYDAGLGLFDFADEQYFSWIRNERILVRGERGEILNDTVTYLKDYLTPIRLDIVRHQDGTNGDLSPPSLRGIQLGEGWIYRNPFLTARLIDDEIALATCLVRMNEYIRTGSEFYTLAEACQDHYLYLMAEQSATEGRPLKTARQAWAN
jgi:predicted dehydrogenase